MHPPKNMVTKPSDHLRPSHTSGMTGGHTLQARAAWAEPKPQRTSFMLRAQGLNSSSSLGSLPVLENTTRCINYNTDPVQV